MTPGPPSDHSHDSGSSLPESYTGSSNEVSNGNTPVDTSVVNIIDGEPDAGHGANSNQSTSPILQQTPPTFRKRRVHPKSFAQPERGQLLQSEDAKLAMTSGSRSMTNIMGSADLTDRDMLDVAHLDILNSTGSIEHLKEPNGGPSNRTSQGISILESEASRLAENPRFKSLMSLRSTAYQQTFGGDTVQTMEAFRLESVRNRQVQIANQRRNMTGAQLFWYDLSAALRRKIRAITSIRLWDGSIKYIESRYGSGIAGFFVLFRWSMLLNLLFCAVWSAVVVGPAIVGLWEINPVTGRQILQEMFFPSDTVWTFQDFFVGGRAMQNTFFFYGSYRPIMINNYRMDLAYMLTVIASYVVCLVAIAVSVQRELISQQNYSTQFAVDGAYPFTTFAFASYNHGVADRKAMINQGHAIANVFRSLLSASEVKDKKDDLDRRARSILYFRRFVVNIIALAILAGVVELVRASVSDCSSYINVALFKAVATIVAQFGGQFTEGCGNTYDSAPFTPYLISTFNLLLPQVFSFLATLEKYSNPTIVTRITIIRLYFLKFAPLILIPITKNFDTSGCWENDIGSQVYTIVWLDFAVNLVSGLLTSAIFKKIRGTYSFDITKGTLEIIYRQALLWIGSIYAPITTYVIVITHFFTFYLKKFIVIGYVDPPKKIYDSYTNVRFFMAYLLLTLWTAAGVILYTLSLNPPSVVCGPYRRDYPGFEFSFSENEGAWTIILKSVRAISNNVLRSALEILGSATVLGPLALICILMVYFLFGQARARLKRIKDLEKQLWKERVDKKNLIRYYNIQT